MRRRFLAVVGILLFSTLMALGDEPPPRTPPPLEFKGYLTPARRALVSSTVQGRITEVLVREGQQVKQGDVVARLDSTRQVYNLERARARMVASRARLTELKATVSSEEKAAEAELRKAETVLQASESETTRLRRLRTSGAVPAEDVQKAETTLRLAKAEVENKKAAVGHADSAPARERIRVAEARVVVAQTNVKLAEEAVAATTLRAPIAGTVLRVHVQVGSITNPAAFGLASSASVCELADTSALEVEVHIHERNLRQFFLGQRCEARLDAFPETKYPGVVKRISPVVDRDSSTFTLWATITPLKKDHGLPVDASAIVRFLPR
jgi:HlyD family secretion protein